LKGKGEGEEEEMEFFAKQIDGKAEYFAQGDDNQGRRKEGCRRVHLLKENGEGEWQNMFDLEYIANSLVSEEERVKHSTHYEQHKEIVLDKLKNYVFADKPDGWQTDDEGRRKFARCLKYNEQAIYELKSLNCPLEQLKRAFEIEKNEMSFNENDERVALIEQYFERFLQGKSLEDKGELLSLYPLGVPSLIEQIGVQGFIKIDDDNCIASDEPFYISGKADIISRDTLYYVSLGYVEPMWVLFYLNILNLIYNKPTLALMSIHSQGYVEEYNIPSFNKEQQIELLKHCKAGSEGFLDDLDREAFLEYLDLGVSKGERLDASCMNVDWVHRNIYDGYNKGYYSVHTYIDNIIEGIEDRVDKRALQLLKKLVAEKIDFSFICFLYDFKSWAIKFLQVILEGMEAVGQKMGASYWDLIANRVINEPDFAPIFSIEELKEIKYMRGRNCPSVTEVVFKLTTILSPYFFLYSIYEGSSKKVEAKFRRVQLDMVLDDEQRRALNEFLKSDEFLESRAVGTLDNERKRLDVLRISVKGKKLSPQYYCGNNAPLMSLPFKFISQLQCNARDKKCEYSSVKNRDLGLVIKRVTPFYLWQDSGEMTSKIEVECEGFDWREDGKKDLRVIFTLTRESNHNLVANFFKSFLIDPCTYDFDDWVNRRGECVVLADGDNTPIYEEADFVVIKGGRRHNVEIKRIDFIENSYPNSCHSSILGF